MDIIITIGLLLCLFAVFVQDWKYRKIHVVLPVMIFIASFFIVKQEGEGITIFKIIGYNTVFFLITLGFLIMYMSLKNKKILNPFENYFGLGDLLFYLAVTPLFLLQNYVVFFILSMVFAILLQMGLSKVIKKETVPLAGFASLLLMLLVVSDVLFNFQKITLL